MKTIWFHLLALLPAVVLLAADQDGESRFVRVNGGGQYFWMGDSAGDGERDEKPAHQVRVRNTYFGRCEVTQREWRELMGGNPSVTKGDDLPVHGVSWYDAVEFCNRKSQKDGLRPCYAIDKTKKDPNNQDSKDERKWTVTCDFKASGYRLPTEAEWETAARGGFPGIRYGKKVKYSGSDDVNEVAWFAGNSGAQVHAVGQKKANDIGLHDLCGNVWEWCWEWYDAGWYSDKASAIGDTPGPVQGSTRVARGGSWKAGAAGVRPSKRGSFPPSFASDDIGFRLVRSADVPVVSYKDYGATKAWLANPSPIPSVIKKGDPVEKRKIRLVVDQGACSGQDVHALGAGIPLREGAVRDLADLGIANSAGELLPAEFEKRTAWTDGSAQWVWTDFQGRLDREYFLVIRGGKGSLPTPGVTVGKTDSRIIVNNGVLELKWDRRLATPVEVALVSGQDRKTNIAAGDGRGIYLVDQNSLQAALGGNGSELQLEVESANKLRAVLRAEGWYVTAGGSPVARAIVRYHVYWQQPWIRMDHTFIVTRDNDELWYKEIGVSMPVNSGSAVRFGVKGGSPIQVALDAAAKEAYIHQDKYPFYYKTESRFVVGKDGAQVATGQEAGGWAELVGEGGSLFLAVRDFAPQFPKEIAATRGGLTAKLWSGRDGRVLDYKVSTLIHDWWGTWFDRIPLSSVVQNELEQMKLVTDANERKWRQDRLLTVEKAASQNPSCVGVARTHSLMVAWYPGTPDPSRADAWNALLDKPMVIQPDPRWMMHVDPRIVTPMIARGEGGPEYDAVERGISAWVDMMRVPQAFFFNTGWYEWGRHPYMSYQKAEDGAIYAEFYRLAESANAYHYNLSMMETWMRSGDRRYLEETERVNRWLADTSYFHWEGGRSKRQKGFMANFENEVARQMPLPWQGKGSPSSETMVGESMTSFVYEYFLRDNRRYKCLFDATTDAVLKHFDVNEPDGLADIPLGLMTALYRVNQNKELLEKMKKYVRSFTDPSSPNGGNAAFWQGSDRYTSPGNGVVYKAQRKTFNLIRYYDATGDDYVAPIVVRLFMAWLDMSGARYTQPFDYEHYAGGVAARVYHWTKDPDMLFWARQQVEGAAEVFQRFEELPPDQKGIERCKSQRPGAVYSSYHCKNVKFKADYLPGEGVLYFAFDSTPAIISLPTAIWALKGYPDYQLSKDASE